MTVVEELGISLATIAEEVGGACVGVGSRWAMGSGIVISPGRILTNAHNVAREETEVGLPGGGTARADVVGIDLDTDIAVLSVDTGEIVPVPWEPASVAPRLGAPVMTLANPGGRGLRVTMGFVAAVDRSFRGPRGRRIFGGFEHTAPLPPGSSGGPVVDTSGHLLGINTRRLGRGFYLALPADNAMRDLVATLQTGAAPQGRRLGVGLAPLMVARRLRRSLGLEERDGLLVRLVEDESPAARAGVREGDLIVRAGDAPTTDIDDLHRALAATPATLELGLVRVNDEISVTVEFE